MTATIAGSVTALRLPGPFLTALREGLERLGDRPLAPALDLYTTARTIVATLALPGVQRDRIAISLAEDHVAVSCSTRDREESTGTHYVHHELNRGRLTRSFWLPVNVVPAAATASLENGLLTLTVPTADAHAPRCDEVVEVRVD